ISVIDQIEEKFLVTIFFLIVVFLFAQVVGREVFNNSLPWSEEIGRYLFIWMCWVSVSLSERFNKHIQITMFRDRLSPGAQVILDTFVKVLLIATALFLIVTGFQMAFQIFQKYTVSPGVQIPLYLVYLSMPIGVLLYTVRIVT